MMEIDDINTKLPKRHVRLNLSLYGKSNSIHICRDIIRILGFPKYISLKIKDFAVRFKSYSIVNILTFFSLSVKWLFYDN